MLALCLLFLILGELYVLKAARTNNEAWHWVATGCYLLSGLAAIMVLVE